MLSSHKQFFQITFSFYSLKSLGYREIRGYFFLSNVLFNPNSSDWVSNHSFSFPLPAEILGIWGIILIFQMYVLKLHEAGRNWHPLGFYLLVVQWKAKSTGFGVRLNVGLILAMIFRTVCLWVSYIFYRWASVFSSVKQGNTSTLGKRRSWWGLTMRVKHLADDLTNNQINRLLR